MVQPTPEVARRFGLPYRDDIPDIDIWDRSDLQGIVAIAYEDILTRLTDVLRRRLGWVITRTPRVAKSSIYRARVVGRDDRTGHMRIDLGTITGLLPDRSARSGSTMMVQVRAHDYGRKAPILSSSITVPGRAVVLLPESVVRLSTKIKDPEERRSLIALGKKLKQHTDDWGILWRTAAMRLTEEELRDEVEDLLDVAQGIYNKYNDMEDFGILFEGTSNADIEFPAEVKENLDKTRGKIKPTVERHHFYKSAGYSPLVDFAEMMIEERPEELNYVTSKLEKVVGREMPRTNDPINIEHVKLDGRAIVLARGRVIEVNQNEVVIRRQFRYTTRKLKMTPENSDDVDVPRDDGDYAITHAIPGSMRLVTDYFSRQGKLKGTYVNINTGIELYPSNGSSPCRVRYVDLEIDVVNPKRGETRIIDQHLLKRAVQRGFITDDMADIARQKAKAEYQRLTSKRN